METQPDFKELLELFNAHSVNYLIVGAYALAFHGAPRYTGDLDIFVQPTVGNAASVMAALRDFGFGNVGITESDFTMPDIVVQLGYPPVRVDLMTTITGVTWETVDRGAVVGEYGNVPVRYIGKDEYKINKRQLGRKKDLADIEALGED
ncbi:MAG TPA: hypothetical protein VN494_06520 [Patescibacteria group bacterium]|nr:hypothetical protein [Patescibacteria group bacterium]